MSQKLQIAEGAEVIKDKEISEKEHPWLDEELYPEQQEDEDATCWEKFKKGASNFINRTVDYFEFDRLFYIEGDKKIDLKRCNKRFLENYDETYSERELKFGYTFEYVLEEKIKEEQKKQKDFWTEVYRFICCEGGNEMIEVEEAYKSDREYEVLIKKKIMERKQEYEEEKREQEQRRKKEEMHQRQQTKEVMQLQSVQPQQQTPEPAIYFQEQPAEIELAGGSESHKRQRTKYLNIKKVKVNQQSKEIVQNEVYNQENVFMEQKNSGRIHVQTRTKQNKNIHYTQTNTSEDKPDLSDSKGSPKQNQVTIPRRTTSENALKAKGLVPDEEEKTKVITHEQHIYKNIYHQNIEERTVKQQRSNLSEQDPEDSYPQAKKKKKNVKKQPQPQEQEEYAQEHYNAANSPNNPINSQRSPKTNNQNYNFHQSPNIAHYDLPQSPHNNQQELPRSPKITFDEPDDFANFGFDDNAYEAASKQKKKKKLNKQIQDDLSRQQEFYDQQNNANRKNNEITQAAMNRTETNNWRKDRQNIQGQTQEVGAKKKRRAKKQIHPEFQMDGDNVAVENPSFDDFGNSEVRNSASMFLGSSENEVKVSKKKRVRKQIKQQVPEHVFDEVVLDDMEFVQGNNSTFKKEENYREQEGQGVTVSQARMEKKRKKPKAIKQVQQNLDQVIDLDL